VFVNSRDNKIGEEELYLAKQSRGRRKKLEFQ